MTKKITEEVAKSDKPALVHFFRLAYDEIVACFENERGS